MGADEKRTLCNQCGQIPAVHWDDGGTHIDFDSGPCCGRDGCCGKHWPECSIRPLTDEEDDANG